MLQHALRKLNLQHLMAHFYAVARGHEVGVYDSWSKCEQQVKGFKGARYKKFPTRSEAESFIKNELGVVTGIAAQYAPKEVAVPLGRKKRLKQIKEKNIPLKVVSEDFWPASDGDSFAGEECDELTESELLAAATAIEAELIMPNTTTQTSASGSLKRKTSEASTSGKTSKLAKYESKIWQPVGNKHIGGHEFAMDEEGYVIVYTDGSCINNGQANACAGFGVYFGDEHPLNAASPVSGRVTNNVGEIQAAIHAIKVATDVGISKLCISTDSQFLIRSATCWITAWKRKNWKLKDGGDVKNVVDFKVLDALLQSGNVLVKWNYVKAHKGIKGNEIADSLARAGSDKHRLMQK